MKKEGDYYIVCDQDYDEDNWLDDVFGWILDALVWVVIFFTNLWNKIFVKAEKRVANQVKYLEGNSIREGNFYCLCFIKIELLIEKRELVKNQLQFIFWKNPQLLIGLINLKTGDKERKFLNEVMSGVFSFSKQNFNSAVSKILCSEMSVSDKTLLVSYMIQNYNEKKREHFISFFRETFKKMGDPMKSAIEKVIGKEL